MKKIAQGLLVVGLVLSLSAAVMAYDGGLSDYPPGTGINGTVHDLSIPGAHGMTYGPNPTDPLTRICIWCHTPHNAYRLSVANGGPAAGIGGGPQATDSYTYLPLWNHMLPVTDPTYVMYKNGPGAPQTGSKASQAILNGMTPGSTSLLCLSCHDGTIAVNQYGNSFQPAGSISTGSSMMTPAYQIGKDRYLGNHHPIGFDYVAAQAGDVEIRDPDAAFLTHTTSIRDHLLGDPLNPGTNTKMECGTCHSVHNTGNSGERLLWRSDQNSELCLTCHAKGTYTAP